MPCDMLVKLYDLPDSIPNLKELEMQGIFIKRAMSADKAKVVDYVRKTFWEHWANECESAFSNKPVSCFIAVKDKKVIGFSCYNTTCLNFFGPIGISEEYRKGGIGKALMLKCLLAMRNEGYGYAIIGWVDEALNYYKKTINAIPIENSFPGVYKNLIDQKAGDSI